MTDRALFLLKFLLAIALAHPAQAEELPVIGQSALGTPSRSEEQRDLGLEMLWLPVESRDSITDYAGRNLPGAALSADGRLIIRGGRAQDTALELNGLRVRSLSLPLGLVERFDLATAGYGAAWSDAMGGVLAVTTKAVSNRLHVDANLFGESHANPTKQGDPIPFGVAEASASMPLVRDKLFVLAAVRSVDTQNPADKDQEGIIPDSAGRHTRGLGGGLVVTWLPRPGQRLEGLTLLDITTRENGGGLGVLEEAQPFFEDRQLTSSLRWSGRLGERLEGTALVGYQGLRAEEAPLRCRSEGESCDGIAPQIQLFPRMIASQNWYRHIVERTREWQLGAGLEARLHEGASVRQRLRFTSNLRASQLRWDSRVPGDRYTEFQIDPAHESTTFVDDPRFGPPRMGWFSAGSSWWTTTSSLESETGLLDRLWVLPGLGLTASEVRTDPFTLRLAALTPHLGLAWNAQGDGRTWLRASVHRRTSGDLEQPAKLGQRRATTRRCAWDTTAMTFTKDCTWSGGDSRNTVGLPCGPINVQSDGTPCAAGLRLPRSWEYALGLDQALGAGIRAGVDVVYRRTSDLPLLVETNRVWNSAGDLTSGYRNGRAEVIQDYTTSPTMESYRGATLWFSRPAGRFKFLASYTLSWHDTIFPGAATWTGAGYLWPTGTAPDDRRSVFRALASYDFGGFASAGLLYSRESGLALTRLSDPALTQFAYHAPVGVSPGLDNGRTNDREVARLPGQQRLNVQLRARGRRLIRADLDLYIDLVQLVGSRPVSSPSLGTQVFATSITDSRAARVGLEYRY
jgi:hypothetical protein